MSGRRSGTWLRGGHGVLASGAAVYLTLFPLGSFLLVRSGELRVTGSDVLLAVLLLLAGVTWVRSPGFRATVVRGMKAGWRGLRPGDPGGPARDFAASILLLAAFGVWVGLSGIWGSDPAYALAEGAGYLALTAGVAVIAGSGLEWDVALSAWLTGVFLTAAISLALAIVAVSTGDGGGWDWAGRVVYDGAASTSSLDGRLRGPFFHPGGLGEYLVVSGALAWGWWATRSRVRRVVAWSATVGVCLLVPSMVLSASSAWLAAGVLLLLWGRRLGSRPERSPRSSVGPTPRGVGALMLRGVGALITATTLAALVFPLRMGWGRWRVVTSGVRVPIWQEAFRTFLSRPVTGIGAARPVLDGVGAGESVVAGIQGLDPHSVYLSLLVQFGIVGILLVGAAAFFLIRAVRRRRGSPPAGRVVRTAASESSGTSGAEDDFVRRTELYRVRERARTAVLAALLVVGVHGLVSTGEDLVHRWLLVALAGLAAGVAAPQGTGRGSASASSDLRGSDG